jgi:hypothetical protein
MREFWNDPKLERMLEIEVELLAPDSTKRVNYYSLIEHKDGKRIRLGYWPVAGRRMISKLTQKLYSEYNDPDRYSFYASSDIPPEEELDTKHSDTKEASEVTNIMDAKDPKHEVIGTVISVRPSKHKEGFDIVKLETPDGFESTMMLPSGKYTQGDIIRGEKVPLEEYFKQEKNIPPEPQVGPQLVTSAFNLNETERTILMRLMQGWSLQRNQSGDCIQFNKGLDKREEVNCNDIRWLLRRGFISLKSRTSHLGDMVFFYQITPEGENAIGAKSIMTAASKLKWRVDSPPTGRFRSFEHRCWPAASYLKLNAQTSTIPPMFVKVSTLL